MTPADRRTELVVDRKPDGTLLVRSAQDLGAYAEKMTERLDFWAARASYRTFLAERDAKGRWRNVTYAEAQYFARRIGQALIHRGLSVERPVLILSGNDIEHAMLSLGAMYAGVPYAPISVPYSLASENFDELRYIFELLTPGLVFVDDGLKYERALRAVMPDEVELVVNESPLPGASLFADLVNTDPEASIDHAHSHVHADTVCKILFTSGSTGMPRGVIQTHRNWCSNQEQVRACFTFLAAEPPVMVERLPWSHAFGNANFGLVLYNGGSLYIDHGEDSHNLRVIAPTIFWGIAKEFDALMPALLNDAEFRKHFFSRLKLLCCAGEGLPPHVSSELTRISARPVSGFGATESGPYALLGGAPVPGMELKLVPADAGKFEARVRGPNVTWGYWRRLDQTRAAFDEEKFFKLGDDLQFADEAEAHKLFEKWASQ